MRTTPAAFAVLPATIDRWPDVELLLGGDGPDRGCWCQPWRGLGRLDFGSPTGGADTPR